MSMAWRVSFLLQSGFTRRWWGHFTRGCDLRRGHRAQVSGEEVPHAPVLQVEVDRILVVHLGED